MGSSASGGDDWMSVVWGRQRVVVMTGCNGVAPCVTWTGPPPAPFLPPRLPLGSLISGHNRNILGHARNSSLCCWFT